MRTFHCFISHRELTELAHQPADKPTVLMAWKVNDIAGMGLREVEITVTDEAPPVAPLPWYAPIKGFFHLLWNWRGL